MESKWKALSSAAKISRGLARCVLVVMAGFLIACGEKNAPEKPKAEKTASEQMRENRLYYDNYLYQCPENEVRCLWFADKDMKVAMIMWLDTKETVSYFVRDDEKHAMSARPVNYIHNDITLLEQQKAKLVVATPTVNFVEDVHIAFWYKGKLFKRSYPRSDVPLAVQRIYVIGGIALNFNTESFEPIVESPFGKKNQLLKHSIKR